jgi:hypothetical protein
MLGIRPTGQVDKSSLQAGNKREGDAFCSSVQVAAGTVDWTVLSRRRGEIVRVCGFSPQR